MKKKSIKKGADTTLTEQDLHCMARILQGIIFEDSLFFGCNYCRFRNDCQKDEEYAKHFDTIRKKMERITGLYLGHLYNPDNPEEKFNYQRVRD